MVKVFQIGNMKRTGSKYAQLYMCEKSELSELILQIENGKETFYNVIRQILMFFKKSITCVSKYWTIKDKKFSST